MGDTGQPIIFDGSGSTAGTAPIVRYEWNMADGTILAGQTVQYTYNTPGPYEVQLKVIDQAGRVGEAVHSIMINPTVEATPPTAVIQAPDFGNTGQAITFDGSASTQGTAAIDATSGTWAMARSRTGRLCSTPTIDRAATRCS